MSMQDEIWDNANYRDPLFGTAHNIEPMSSRSGLLHSIQLDEEGEGDGEEEGE